MTPDDNDLKETAELDRLIDEALTKISEHADCAIVFATKRLENGKGETYRYVQGVGNHYARYGVVRTWLNEQDGMQSRRFDVDYDKPDDDGPD